MLGFVTSLFSKDRMPLPSLSPQILNSNFLKTHQDIESNRPSLSSPGLPLYYLCTPLFAFIRPSHPESLYPMSGLILPCWGGIDSGRPEIQGKISSLREVMDEFFSNQEEKRTKGIISSSRTLIKGYFSTVTNHQFRPN